jgi:hypothetical protein
MPMLNWTMLAGAVVAVSAIMLVVSTRLRTPMLTWVMVMEAVVPVVAMLVVAKICYVKRLNCENRRSGFSK